MVRVELAPSTLWGVRRFVVEDREGRVRITCRIVSGSRLVVDDVEVRAPIEFKRLIEILERAYEQFREDCGAR